jgi:hypothetical protein
MDTSMSIAIIKPNKFDKLSITKKNYYEEVKKEIEQYVSIINVSDTQDMLVKMTETLLENKIETLTTERAYESNSEIFEICHSMHWSNFDSITINENHTDHSEEDKILEFPNNIANILTHNSLKVYGVAVLIKNTYQNGVCTMTNITIDDIIKVIYKKTIFKGIRLNTDSEMFEFEYINSPLEYIHIQERPKYIGSTEIKVIDKALIMYVDSATEQNELKYNDFASFLAGTSVYGQVYIAFRQIPKAINYDDPEKPDYIDIDINTLTNIIDIFKSLKAYNTFKNIEIEDEQERNKPKITTFYSILSEYKEKAQTETKKRTIIKQSISLNTEIRNYLSQTLKKNK